VKLERRVRDHFAGIGVTRSEDPGGNVVQPCQKTLISHVAAYFKKLSCVFGKSWNFASIHSVRSFHNFSVFL
jgi:hypothetical protein